jgi:hypothetical protein
VATGEAAVQQMDASGAGRAHRGNGPEAGDPSQRAEGRSVDPPLHVMVPGFADPIATVPPPALAALRDKALAIYQEMRPAFHDARADPYPCCRSTVAILAGPTS